jgi:4-aminobutyrate aminotransferase
MRDLRAPMIVSGPPGQKVKNILALAGLNPEDYSSPIISKAEGIYIKDPDENIFLDLISGRCVTNIGHNHPHVIEAIHNQVNKCIHWQTEEQFKLAKRLSEITPGSWRKQVYWTQSGSMAVELALKVARRATKKPYLISFTGAYHGVGFGSLTVSGYDPVMKRYYGPLLPGVYHIPFPYCFRCPFHNKYPDCSLACLNYIEDHAFKSYIPPEEVAAILVEPVQGDAGWHVPPDGWHKGIAELCEQHDILLIADEIQTGFGRTGKLFGMNHWEVKPDIILLGKSMASGIPIAATLLREDILHTTDAESIPIHAQSFSGSPLGCVAANATIDVIEKERLWEKSQKIGSYLKKRLDELKEDHEIIGDVRGLGLLIGIEVVENKKSLKPGERESTRICKKSFGKGVFLLKMGAFGTQNLRIAPPLIINKEQTDSVLKIIKEVITDTETNIQT